MTKVVSRLLIGAAIGFLLGAFLDSMAGETELGYGQFAFLVAVISGTAIGGWLGLVFGFDSYCREAAKKSNLLKVREQEQGRSITNAGGKKTRS